MAESTRDDLGCDRKRLRGCLDGLLDRWRTGGIPSRRELAESLQEVIDWRERSKIESLWDAPPLMISATLDDGWGHGLQIIEACAKAAGVQSIHLGLMVPPESILLACSQFQPSILGLTVLQLDSEESLVHIGKNLPPKTTLIAGGAAFQADPELASRSSVTFVARNVADFLAFILNL